MKKSRLYFFITRLSQIRQLSWIAAALAFLGIFLKLSWELYEDAYLDALDREVLLWVAGLRSAHWNGVAVDLTALGSFAVITLFTLIGVILLALKRDWRGSGYLAIGSIGAGLGTTAMKLTFTRVRPTVIPRLVEVQGYSYPSGHTLGATAFYLLLLFLSWRTFLTWRSRALVSICAGVLICGVAGSRIYLGVHYPSDVLSGICLGAAWVLVLTAAMHSPR